jgi:endonuclease/exonuclease/phosphatase family metal-dependent hydrolase
MKDKLEKHRKSKASLFVLGLISIVVFTSIVRHDGSIAEDRIKVMFYNVENLFDTINSNLDDDEFLPWGDKQWNTYKYRRKLRNLAKVIISSGSWDPPAIIGLCEVENTMVVSDLVSTTILKDIGYNYFFAKTADARGIGVALVYSESFTLLSSEILYPTYSSGDTLATRSILFAELTDNIDTLGVVVTHWPSRRGGVAASDPKRDLVSTMIFKRFVADPGKEGKRMKLIIMGDLNCEPDSPFIKRITSNTPDGSGKHLINTSNTDISAFKGSYKYQGRWMLYDQILISQELINSSRGYSYMDKSFQIIGNDFQMTEDNAYRGYKPKASWRGPVFTGGYSDHLPVTIDLNRKP